MLWGAGGRQGQLWHRDTEQGTAAELTEHQGHLLEPQFTISVTEGWAFFGTDLLDEFSLTVL